MGLNSNMDNFAKANGLSFDNKTLTIFGVYNNHNICIAKNSDANSFDITLCLKQGSVPPTVTIEQAFPQMKAQSSNGLISYSFDKSKIVFKTAASVFINSICKNLLASIQEITNYFNANGYIDCCYECLGETGIEIDRINGGSYMLCTTCYDGVVSNLEMNKQVIKSKKGNIATGIVGAFLGSLIGVVVFVLIGQLGYIAVISGIVMAVCTLKGYELMGGKISILGVSISCVFMIAMVWLASTLNISLLISREFGINVFDAFKILPDIYAQFEEVFTSFISDLVISYVLTAVGAVPVIISLFKQKNGSYQTIKLTHSTVLPRTAEMNNTNVVEETTSNIV